MAYSKEILDWIPGWSEDGTDITIAAFATAFPEMTAEDADTEEIPPTGDIAEVWYAINHAMYDKWAAQATADKPSNWTLNKSSSTNSTTGKVKVTFSAQFTTTVAVGCQTVDDEEA